MNSQRIIREIQALARFLDMAYMPKTAAAVRDLTEVDLMATDPETWHPALFALYRDEVRHSLNILGEPDPDHHRALVDGLDGVVTGAVTCPEPWSAFLRRMHPTVEVIGQSHGNTRELYRSFVASGASRKHVYINLCLMYLILCEGVFPGLARLLLGLHKVSHGEVPDSKPLQPAALAQRLNEVGMGVFAIGYNRHLRNAIAHGHFRYDPEPGTMRFCDYSYHEGEIRLTYDQSWPPDRFVWQFARMDDVYLVLATYLQVHLLPGIRDLGSSHDQRVS